MKVFYRASLTINDTGQILTNLSTVMIEPENKTHLPNLNLRHKFFWFDAGGENSQNKKHLQQFEEIGYKFEIFKDLEEAKTKINALKTNCLHEECIVMTSGTLGKEFLE